TIGCCLCRFLDDTAATITPITTTPTTAPMPMIRPQRTFDVGAGESGRRRRPPRSIDGISGNSSIGGADLGSDLAGSLGPGMIGGRGSGDTFVDAGLSPSPSSSRLGKDIAGASVSAGLAFAAAPVP